MFIDLYTIILLFFSGLFLSKIFILIGNNLHKKSAYINICDCKNTYKISELLPLLSYFKTRYKCPYCGKSIPILFSLLELNCAIFYSLSYVIYGFSYEMFATIIITSLLTIIFVSDLKYYIINDRPVLISIILILLLKYIYFGLQPFYLSLVSGIIIYALMYFLRIFGNIIFKKESLGGGDVKLSALFGCTLGIKLSIIAIILGALLSFPKAINYTLTKNNREIAFGPYLITGLLLVFLLQDYINNFINLIVK